MAIQKRYNGDAAGLVNVDISINGVSSAGKVISTGIGKHPTAIKISGGASFAAEFGVGGAVETVLRTLAVKATLIAYQVDAAQLSVLVEATGWGTTTPTGDVVATADADLTAALVALGNRAADDTLPVSAYDFTALVASTAGGLKLA